MNSGVEPLFLTLDEMIVDFNPTFTTSSFTRAPSRSGEQ